MCDSIYIYYIKHILDRFIVLSPVEHHTTSNVNNTIIVNFYFSVAVLAVRRECQETIGKYTGKHITEIITVLCNLRQLQEKKYKISITEVTTIFFFISTAYYGVLNIP